MRPVAPPAPDYYLGMARNPQCTNETRLEAFIRYEAEMWARAVIDRGLQMSESPQSTAYCPTMGDRINALLETRLDFRLDRKALPAAQAGATPLSS